MQTSTGIRERIDHVYPSLRPAERAVAQYVRDHLAEASELTVGQLAEVARVSEPTVIRFSRKLGFGGYRELRYVLRQPAGGTAGPRSTRWRDSTSIRGTSSTTCPRKP